MSTDEHEIPPDVRAAIHAFLDERHSAGRSFSVTQAIDAIRRVFPALEISDAELADAMTSEASVAGLEVEIDVATPGPSKKRMSLERWENEGGARGASEPES